MFAQEQYLRDCEFFPEVIELIKHRDPMGAAALMYTHGKHDSDGDECLQFLFRQSDSWPSGVAPNAARDLLLRCCIRHVTTAAKAGRSTVLGTDEVNRANAVVLSSWNQRPAAQDVRRGKMLLAQARMQLLYVADLLPTHESSHTASSPSQVSTQYMLAQLLKSCALPVVQNNCSQHQMDNLLMVRCKLEHTAHGDPTLSPELLMGRIGGGNVVLLLILVQIL